MTELAKYKIIRGVNLLKENGMITETEFEEAKRAIEAINAHDDAGQIHNLKGRKQ